MVVDRQARDIAAMDELVYVAQALQERLAVAYEYEWGAAAGYSRLD
jgi:hypothetical protein